MIVALSLLGYAGVLLTAGARALSRARWPDSAPALVGFQNSATGLDPGFWRKDANASHRCSSQARQTSGTLRASAHAARV